MSRLFGIIGSVVAILAGAFPARGAEPRGIECVSSLYLSRFAFGSGFGSLSDIHARDGLLWIAGRGLVALDVSDPFLPEVVSYFSPTPGSSATYDVMGVVDDTVYLTRSPNIDVIDISDVTAPVLVQQMNGGASDIRIIGDRMYVAAGSRARMYDITDRFAPVLVTDKFNPRSGESIDARGDLVAYAQSFDGFILLDFATPGVATQLAAVGDIGVVIGVRFVGEMLYVATRNDGVLVFDVSDPASPTLRGSLEIGSLLGDMRLEGDRLYVRDRHGPIFVVDVANPAEPSVLGLYQADGPNDVAIDGGLLFISDGGDEIIIVNGTTPHEEQEISRYESDWISPSRLWVDGPRAVVLSASSGRLELVDYSGAEPVSLYAGTFEGAMDATVWGDRIYVSDATGILRVDVPSGTVTRVHTTGSPVEAVCTADGRLYAAGRNEGLSVFGIDPLSGDLWLVGLEPLSTFQGIFDIAVQGPLCIVRSGNLLAIDVSNPADPVLGDWIPASGMFEIEWPLVWVTDSFGQAVRHYDLSDVNNPVSLGPIQLFGRPDDLSVRDGTLAVAMRSEGIALYDIRDTANTRLTGRYGMVEATTRVSFAGEHLLVATDGGPLLIQVAMGRCDGCAADVAAPWGQVSFHDLAKYIQMYSRRLERADIAQPYGQFNFFDLREFLAQMAAGCEASSGL